MSEILSKDKKHLAIFENNVVIDKRLLKWRRAENGVETTKAPSQMSSGVISNMNSNLGSFLISNSSNHSENSFDPDRNLDVSTKWLPLYETHV